MNWPEGAFDKYLSKSGRWMLHSLAVAWAVYLAYDLFANINTDDGLVAYTEIHILSGASRKLAFMVLVLAGCMVALGLAFGWDLLTSRGHFQPHSTNPNDLQNRR